MAIYRTTIYIEVEAKLGDVNGTDGVFLAALINQGGCDILTADGIYFFLYPKSKQYMVTGNAARTKIYEKGTITGHVSSDWNRFALLIKDNLAVGGVNGNQLFSFLIPSHSHGFAGLGTASYGLADFDNLMLMSFEDGEKRLQDQQANRKSSSDDTLYFKSLHQSSYHP
ncbi:hypothetical protein CHS0354_007226 [Potamilus streckersoni]|uniref:Glycosyl hydrolase family 59 C-terminal lectin domain-containing protein n=1 Tax=Potamilus streckersoni TaxID=2493646 RepID=A0AAE0RYK1_9BIVA|nr:hypothetical protein CHS0354_007226 [Potamilus streckersoni]